MCSPHGLLPVKADQSTRRRYCRIHTDRLPPMRSSSSTASSGQAGTASLPRADISESTLRIMSEGPPRTGCEGGQGRVGAVLHTFFFLFLLLLLLKLVASSLRTSSSSICGAGRSSHSRHLCGGSGRRQSAAGRSWADGEECPGRPRALRLHLGWAGHTSVTSQSLDYSGRHGTDPRPYPPGTHPRAARAVKGGPTWGRRANMSGAPYRAPPHTFWGPEWGEERTWARLLVGLQLLEGARGGDPVRPVGHEQHRRLELRHLWGPHPSRTKVG